MTNSDSTYDPNPSSPSNQFPQQGAYHQSPYPADPNRPFDPNRNDGGAFTGPGAGPNGGYTGEGATGPDGERGLGGAIMGGLAGGFAGHQKSHGFMGALGGALLGSFAQDHLGHKKR